MQANKPTLDEVKSILQPEFAELEKDRASRRRLFQILSAIPGLILLSLVLTGHWESLLFVGAFCLGLWGLLWVLSFWGYSKRVRDLILPKLIETVLPCSEGVTQNYSLADYSLSGLPLGGANSLMSDYRRKVVWGALTYQFAAMHAEYVTTRETRNSDGSTSSHTERHTVFAGLFLELDWPTQIQGTTSVGSRPLFPGMDGKRVLLESPEFNEWFHVSGTDQVESRYLLPLDRMERLLRWKRDEKRQFCLAWKEGKLWVAHDINITALSPKTTADVANSGFLEAWLEYLLLPEQILLMLFSSREQHHTSGKNW